eukprot:CAMPEP_0169155272 /NCGR_PEP_ID=MMETSP1015-20121227/53246_1 /TAXON_ID=342587 /ORGANISM="Karlodinium micrum, Strain CCMP2283" /LENGTH=139 /DNA_ID=CAMNT_0009225697 /DNA_START=30 /DNA_END=449 /DNA_ORIENTATION=-
MTIGGLLVLARTWRFARVGHGVFEAKEMIEEMIGEDDDTVKNMMDAWKELTPERWEEILHSGSAEILRESGVTPAEIKLGEALGNSPAVAMRALAFARGWKQKLDKKKAKRLSGSNPKRQMPGASLQTTATVGKGHSEH